MKHFFLILLTVMTFAQRGHAQLLFFKKRNYETININNADYSERVRILVDKIHVKTEDTLIYAWYAYNKIMRTQGAYDGKLLDGEYVSFYYNNNLREKGRFKNGLREGKWMSWYDSGSIKEISNWNGGQKNGSFNLFNEKGEPLQQAYYKNGKFNGQVITYQSGKPLYSKKYRNGVEVLIVSKILVEKKHSKFQTKLHEVGGKIRSWFKKRKNEKSEKAKENKKETSVKPQETQKQKEQKPVKTSKSVPGTNTNPNVTAK